MNQTINSLRRAWFQLRADPFLPPMLLGYALLLFAAWAFASALPAGIAAVWTAAWFVLSRTCPHGRPRILAEVLTPNFFSVRLLSGRRGVYQRRPAGRGQDIDCRRLLKGLVADGVRLPAALKPGRYRAVTHEMVLHRLEAMPNARITWVRPAYTADMTAICSAMTHGRCKRCKARCPFPASRQKPRQFYDICFQIIH